MKLIKSTVALSQLVAIGITLLVLASCGDERKTYYDEGFLKSEISYKGDVPHGTATYYYKNGKIERKGQWKNGQMDGKWELFCADGQKTEEINFTNGKQDGMHKTLGCGSNTMHEYHYVLNDKGESVEDGFVRSWNLDNEDDWNSKGRLTDEAEYKMGHIISYKSFAHDGSGKIVTEIHYDTSNAFEGLCFNYSFETGDTLLRKGRWEKDRGVGIWVFWDKIKRCYKEIDCDKEKCDRDLWNGYDETYGFYSIYKYECKTDVNADKIKNAASFDLKKNAEFTKDIDQVLKDVENLQKNGKTVLGDKRDKADEDSKADSSAEKMNDESNELLSAQILKKLSSVEMSKEELRNYSKEDLRFLRNAIFAKHGYIFKSDDLKNYFSQFAWYTAKYSDIMDQLTPVEKKNIALLKSLEK